MKDKCEVLMKDNEGKKIRPCLGRGKHEIQGVTYCGGHSPFSRTLMRVKIEEQQPNNTGDEK